jgi:hypothetical protein
MHRKTAKNQDKKYLLYPRAKLLKIAAGRYCSMKFGLTLKDGKPVDTDCWLYVESGYSSGAFTTTWEMAFESLDRMMNLKPKKLEEEPVGVEDKNEEKIQDKGN